MDPAIALRAKLRSAIRDHDSLSWRSRKLESDILELEPHVLKSKMAEIPPLEEKFDAAILELLPDCGNHAKSDQAFDELGVDDLPYYISETEMQLQVFRTRIFLLEKQRDRMSAAIGYVFSKIICTKLTRYF